ncbi:N-acetyltransferase [Streptomyces sp. SP18ES09]|uniref:N-acetyltransferase n=1 Tax=Streptomyces sp. SP18ES09 TaxID=3002532 RepID=UPI002E75EFE9|nr:N-acetyltransferase [Streptomyces sp. SP18ES09]MEE1816593.1 N-acetyltransferase [Streptomyces sp. SP18ES09]
MDLNVSTLAARPELEGAMWSMKDLWPEFMMYDPVGWATMGRIAREFPEFVLVATDAAGDVVARGFSVPFRLDVEGRRELPDRGWDEVLNWAFSDLRHGRTPDTVSAIEITVGLDHLGKGVSHTMLAALRENAGARGFAELVAPVRPNGKHLEASASVHEYAFRTREEDGLPADPWLRVHVRAGGVIEAVAPASMTVSGSVEQWRTWTGLPFDADGPVEVPGALVPVHCEATRGYAVYVEPNVWVRHRI